MSYLSQMAGLAWHNFISAAAGIAIAIALARGLTRKGDGSRWGTIGNFWVDLTRATVYVLLPLCLVFALLFVSQGMIQNLAPYQEVTTLEGAKQVIAMGPVASQEAIKQLGTNGGGFFNANAAHPVREPERADQLLLDVPHLPDPRRAHLHVRAHGARPEAGLGALRRHEPAVLRGRGRRLLGRGGRQPHPGGPPGVAADRQHGGQGGPLRRRQLGALRHRHHRRLLRRRQRDARQLHAAGRAGAALQHPARRGHLRRRGRGPLRHPGDGRPLASSSPASWSGARRSTWARRSRRARSSSRCSTRSSSPWSSWPSPPGPSVVPYGLSSLQQRGPARPQRDPLRVHQRDRQQRLRLRRHQRQHALVQHRAGPGHAHRPLLDDRARAGHRRRHGRQEGRAARARARCPPTARCSWPC